MGNFSLINNISSLASRDRLGATSNQLSNTIQRLSSGLRINRSGDDAAGLAIANQYRSDINELTQGLRNASDGQSTLQIVDGGLNTISGLLDRATTLATQSASDTFTGNRATLNDELTKVLSEIDRQAKGIGLGGTAGTTDGRFNKSLDVYVGRGSDATAGTAIVNIDLSNSRVDKTGLSLNSLNIGTGTGNVTGDQALTTLTAAEVLTFQYIGSSGALDNVSISLSAGATASNVLDAINNDATIQAAGITASLDSSSQLVLTSSSLFTVSSDTASGAGQTGIVAGGAADDVAITSAANTVTKTVSAGATVATNQTLSFTGEEIGYANTSKDVTFAANATVATANGNILSAVNTDLDLRAAGVFAVSTLANSTQVQFVSLNDFNLGITSTTGAVAANTSIDALQTPTAATAGTVTGGSTGAKAALVSIKAAIASLGVVQGKVGAGQNRLDQAISLVTAQISNFQAAESRIRDADIAAEASQLSRLSTLQQAGVSALAQANQSSQALLTLLR